MRIPTVTVKCRKTGEEMTINETDWALGSIPGVDMGGWDRIGETRGDSEYEALAAAAGTSQRELVEKQKSRGEELDRKVKEDAPTPSISTKAKTTKKAVTKKKTTKKKTARKKKA